MSARGTGIPSHQPDTPHQLARHDDAATVRVCSASQSFPPAWTSGRGRSLWPEQASTDSQALGGKRREIGHTSCGLWSSGPDRPRNRMTLCNRTGSQTGTETNTTLTQHHRAIWCSRHRPQICYSRGYCISQRGTLQNTTARRFLLNIKQTRDQTTLDWEETAGNASMPRLCRPLLFHTPCTQMLAVGEDILGFTVKARLQTALWYPAHPHCIMHSDSGLQYCKWL